VSILLIFKFYLFVELTVACGLYVKPAHSRQALAPTAKQYTYPWAVISLII